MAQEHWDAVWINAQIFTCDKDLTAIKDGAIATQNGEIVWIGNMTQLPHPISSETIYDVERRCITPGLIDCHTHLVFGGNRVHEFEMRLQGMSYEEIAKKGGGIKSTVKATRELSEEELFEQSVVRAKYLMQSGVTTVEIKSGYGLQLETELKMLRVAKRIGETLPLTVVKTFLGAHTIPNEYANRADDYIDYVCQEMLPIVAENKLADAVDVFCEHIAFNLSQTEKVFAAAKKYGLQIKCHADQLSAMGGAMLAADYHAISVDHLEYLTEEGVKAIAASGTVAVLLPGAFYFLREKIAPPVALLRQHNVPIAIATDCNPGTSPLLSMQLAMNMAATCFGLTTIETLLAATKNAAKALGLEQKGVLKVKNAADFAIWDVSNPAELSYYFGYNPLYGLVKNGEYVV